MSQLDPETIAHKLIRMIERIDDYDDLDPVQVYGALQKAIVQYPQYVKAVQCYLDTLEEE